MNMTIQTNDLLLGDNWVPDNLASFGTGASRPIANAPAVVKAAAPVPFGLSQGRNERFPAECLGERGEAMTSALHKHSQAPVALCAQAVLNVMSTTASSWGRVEAIHGSAMPAAVFLTAIAQSGERKSAVDSLAQEGLKAFERETAKEMQALMPEKGEEPDFNAPIADIRINDTTYEGLLGVLARGQGFACLTNDDAAGFFGGHAMSRDNRQRMLAGLAQLWSGSEIKRARVHGRDSVISDVSLTMALMFQPYLLQQVYGDRELVEQGLLARVLPCYPATTMGTRFFANSDPNARTVITGFGRYVFDTLMELKDRRQYYSVSDDVFSSHLPVLPLSDQARAVLVAFHDEVEVQLADNGKLAKIRAFAGRATENATRLAAIMGLFDKSDVASVSADAAASACQLMRFYMGEFAYILGLAQNGRDESAARELGAWIANEYGPGGIGFDQHISQNGPSMFRKKGARQPLMNALVEKRWIRFLPAGTVVDGSPRAEAFKINPRIKEVM